MTAETTNSPVVTWPVDDLEARLSRALDLASRALAEFGTTGYIDKLNPPLSFGPEKVVAEAAMLVYAASETSSCPEIQRRVEALGSQLVPYARSARALADMALQPRRAFKHAVPHVLLNMLGHRNDHVDDFFRERCLLAVQLAGDLPPSAHFERLWIANHWDPRWLSWTEAQSHGTLLERRIDLLSESRDEAYAHTHLLFYLTDFGRRSPPALSRPIGNILSELEGLLLKYLDLEDYDLSGELLMAWPQLGGPWSPTASFAFRVLAKVEDLVGVLPCGNVDIKRLSELPSGERHRYALASGYHTAFVMGFLCAVTLRHQSLPPTKIRGDRFEDSVWQELLTHVDGTQGHWLEVFAETEDREKQALAPLLCKFAILQTLRRRDYEALQEVLVLANRTFIPEHPLRVRAADLLRAVASAMGVDSNCLVDPVCS